MELIYIKNLSKATVRRECLTTSPFLTNPEKFTDWWEKTEPGKLHSSVALWE